MRILQLTSGIGGFGGHQRVVDHSSRTLVKRGHEVLVVTGDAPGAFEAPYQLERCELLNGVNRPEASSWNRLMELVEGFRPEVIASHQTVAPEVVGHLATRYCTLEVLHGFVCAGGKLFRKHDRSCTHAVGWRCLLDWYKGPCGTDVQPAEAVRALSKARRHLELLEQLNGVIVGSQFMRDYLLNEGMRPDIIHVARYESGIDAQLGGINSRRRAADVSLLYVGRVVYNKGLQYAVRALSLLGDAFKLIVVGDGWYRSSLEALVSRLNLRDQVTFRGFLSGSELRAAYLAADVVVVPSIWPEPVGLVVAEASGFGLPVVTFDSGGLAEWREQYPNVHVAARGSIDSLAEMIKVAIGTAKPTSLARPITERASPELEDVIIGIGQRNLVPMPLTGAVT